MRIAWPSASAIPPGEWRWPHIDPKKEWADRLTGEIVAETEFLDKLEKLRRLYGKPLIFNSCYRTPAHNEHVSATRSTDGAHTLGCAADIECSGADARLLLALAMSVGFAGLGIQQKGTARFLHVDDAPDRPDAPRPWLWSY